MAVLLKYYMLFDYYTFQILCLLSIGYFALKVVADLTQRSCLFPSTLAICNQQIWLEPIALLISIDKFGFKVVDFDCSLACTIFNYISYWIFDGKWIRRALVSTDVNLMTPDDATPVQAP